MKIMLDTEVHQAANGVWLTFMSPRQVSMFGQPKTTRGQRSILLVDSAEFDTKRHVLELEADAIIVLNLGSTPSVLVVEVGSLNQQPKSGRVVDPATVSGPGDREFIELASRELEGEARKVAEEILRQVRIRSAGDLLRGQRNNFSNSPDNFWYVIIQPRAQALSITVRGEPKRFGHSILKLKDDRPGYTRFSLKRLSDVAEAIRIIEASKKR
jgi:hypothetical protein